MCVLAVYECVFYFFFFQAEDGIRDVAVTGVQTCALPILPHRYPMLLVDCILAIDRGERAVGLKNVSMDEPFFSGHVPGHPVMPAALVLEAMAQVGAVLVSLRPDAVGHITHLVSVERVRFRRPIVPGDQIIIEVVALRGKGRFGKAQATAVVDGVVAAEGVLTYGMVNTESG